jgi:hypothetical protein
VRKNPPMLERALRCKDLRVVVCPYGKVRSPNTREGIKMC